MLADLLGRELIRLQCYEGIDASQALYEWNYSRQLIAVRALDASGARARSDLFGPEFLVERPLLAAIRAGSRAVLLVDELDRADDEFEAFLLEILSEFAVTIPEVGRVAAERPPAVIVTSNRTRELHDALKRRCLYHWIDHPGLDREVEIVRARAPQVREALARDVAEAVARLRELDLAKRPGVAETIDWANALAFLGADRLEAEQAARHPGRGREGPRGPGAGGARLAEVSGTGWLSRSGRGRGARAAGRVRAGAARSGAAGRHRPDPHFLPGGRRARPDRSDSLYWAGRVGDDRPQGGPRRLRRRLRRLVPVAPADASSTIGSTCRRWPGRGSTGGPAGRPRGAHRSDRREWHGLAEDDEARSRRRGRDPDRGERGRGPAVEVVRRSVRGERAEVGRLIRALAVRAPGTADAPDAAAPKGAGSTCAGRCGGRCARRGSRSSGRGATAASAAGRSC